VTNEHPAEPQGVALGFNLLETSFLQHGTEGCRLGEVEHRVGEVLVGPTVAGNESAEEGEDVQEIEFVQRQKEGVGGNGEFQHTHHAARTDDAVHLVESLLEVFEVADTKSHADSIDAVVVHVQLLTIVQAEFDVEFQGFHLLSAHFEHTLRDVGANDRRYACLGNGDGEVAGAASNVQYRLGVVAHDAAHGLPSPTLIYVEREDVVQFVVCRRNVVEEIDDEILLSHKRDLLFWYLLFGHLLDHLENERKTDIY